jgi:molybdenum cofactor cytidylyltransferase
VIFPRRYFPELLSVDGDRGAKSVLDANSDQVLAVNFEAASIDIDHPDDLAGI